MKTITKNKKHSCSGWIWLALIFTAMETAAGQDTAAKRPQRVIVVSIPDRQLAVLENGNVIQIFQVAVGSAGSPSPTGTFRIVSQLSNPTYYHPGIVIPPGNDNPIGPRWIGLNKKGYGIHGTNEPRSIGRAASHGCIRMRNQDVKKFYALVSVGDVVEIRSERDAQTAQVFGGEIENEALQASVAGGQ